MAETALISKLAAAIVSEVVADTLALATLALALSTLRAVSGKVVSSTIEALNGLALALAFGSGNLIATWAIAGHVVTSALPAFHWPLAFALALALTTFWAVTSKVVTSAIKAVDWSSHGSQSKAVQAQRTLLKSRSSSCKPLGCHDPSI